MRFVTGGGVDLCVCPQSVCTLVYQAWGTLLVWGSCDSMAAWFLCLFVCVVPLSSARRARPEVYFPLIMVACARASSMQAVDIDDAAAAGLVLGSGFGKCDHLGLAETEGHCDSRRAVDVSRATVRRASYTLAATSTLR